MECKLPPILYPLARDLNLMLTFNSQPNTANLGTSIFQQLISFPQGTQLTSRLVRVMKRIFPYLITPISGTLAVDGALALQRLCPTDYPGRETLTFLPLRAIITRLAQFRHNMRAGVHEQIILQYAGPVIARLQECLEAYKASGQTIPGHLWDMLHWHLRELDPAGSTTAAAIALLIKLTPQPMGKLPTSDESTITRYALLDPPPFRS